MANDDERGFCKKCCINCLAMCCLIPMAWISFVVFDLSEAITGGVFQNLGAAMNTLLSQVGGEYGGIASFLVGGLLGTVMVVFFPIHWLLQYRPDEPMYVLAMMAPWILVTFISALFWARDMKEGFMFGIKIAVSWMVLALVIYLALTQWIGASQPVIPALINGLSDGLTDLPPIWAIVLACLEGGIIGGIFGALAGAIRYKPGSRYKPKKPSVPGPGPTDAFGQPSYGGYQAQPPGYNAPTQRAPYGGYQTQGPPQAPSNRCSNCGRNLEPGEEFCTNCGTRRGA